MSDEKYVNDSYPVSGALPVTLPSTTRRRMLQLVGAGSVLPVMTGSVTADNHVFGSDNLVLHHQLNGRDDSGDVPDTSPWGSDAIGKFSTEDITDTHTEFVDDPDRGVVLEFNGRGTDSHGGSYVIPHENLPPADGQPFTWSMWVKPRINDQWLTFSSTSLGCAVSLRYGNIRLHDWHGSGYDFEVSLDADTYVPESEWTHIMTAVAPDEGDNGKVRLFINGEQKKEITGENANIKGFQKKFGENNGIGWLAADSDGGYDARHSGWMDDLRLYVGVAAVEENARGVYEETSSGGSDIGGDTPTARQLSLRTVPGEVTPETTSEIAVHVTDEDGSVVEGIEVYQDFSEFGDDASDTRKLGETDSDGVFTRPVDPNVTSGEYKFLAVNSDGESFTVTAPIVTPDPADETTELNVDVSPGFVREDTATENVVTVTDQNGDAVTGVDVTARLNYETTKQTGENGEVTLELPESDFDSQQQIQVTGDDTEYRVVVDTFEITVAEMRPVQTVWDAGPIQPLDTYDRSADDVVTLVEGKQFDVLSRFDWRHANTSTDYSAVDKTRVSISLASEELTGGTDMVLSQQEALVAATGQNQFAETGVGEKRFISQMFSNLGSFDDFDSSVIDGETGRADDVFPPGADGIETTSGTDARSDVVVDELTLTVESKANGSDWMVMTEETKTIEIVDVPPVKINLLRQKDGTHGTVSEQSVEETAKYLEEYLKRVFPLAPENITVEARPELFYALPDDATFESDVAGYEFDISNFDLDPSLGEGVVQSMQMFARHVLEPTTRMHNNIILPDNSNPDEEVYTIGLYSTEMFNDQFRNEDVTLNGLVKTNNGINAGIALEQDYVSIAHEIGHLDGLYISGDEEYEAFDNVGHKINGYDVFDKYVLNESHDFTGKTFMGGSINADTSIDLNSDDPFAAQAGYRDIAWISNNLQYRGDKQDYDKLVRAFRQEKDQTATNKYTESDDADENTQDTNQQQNDKKTDSSDNTEKSEPTTESSSPSTGDEEKPTTSESESSSNTGDKEKSSTGGEDTSSTQQSDELVDAVLEGISDLFSDLFSE